MRSAILTLGLLLTVAAAGCAGSGDDGAAVATAQSGPVTASAGPSAAASDDPDAPLKFSKCMRENGMTWFPDPQPDGGLRVRTPKDVDPAKMKAAQEACKQYAPWADADRRLDPEALEKVRQMAKCMRENGVPDFPDPQPNGGIAIERGQLGVGPGDPVFDKAREKCEKFMPKPADAEGGRRG